MTKKQKRMLARILCGAALFVVALLLPTEGLLRGLTFLVPYLVVGTPVLWAALRSVCRGQFLDEKFLMAVASLGAFFLGEYPEGVAVMLFSHIGELFESYAVGKSRASVAELMNLCPDEATVLRDGVWVTVFPEEVAVGESIRILPGEKIPLDGVVLQGTSSLDTRSLTGEFLPRDVTEGDRVLSGCVNLSGVLVLRTEKVFEESTASKILTLVETAADNKSKSETFVSSFARWYTPLVLGFAAAVALVPPIFLGGWGEWLHRALTFLVVSCPCALVISVPLTYFGGIGGASRKGILVKGSCWLETLAKADTFVFDKTGTLTKGEFRVSAVLGENPEKGLEIAARCEQFSNHPIARSLCDAYGGSLTDEGIADFEEVVGYGVSATVDGVPYVVGNAQWLEQHGIDAPAPEKTGTCVYVADARHCLCTVVISDAPRENASAVISDLRKLGICKTAMLTGDGAAVAAEISQAVGLDEYCAQLLPGEKVEALGAYLQERRGTVVYVGDGMNDAPVLAAADVGIAMGAFGSDAAIEAADVVLMTDDLSNLPKAVSLAKKTHRIVLENLIFSIGVKVLVMLFCALGLANMWHAVFADVGVSVIAILNAMRTLAKKE